MKRAVVIVLMLLGVVPFTHAAIMGWGLAATIRELPIYAACIMVATLNVGGRTVWKAVARTVAICGIFASVLIIAAGASNVLSSTEAASQIGLDYPVGLHPFLSGTLFPQLALTAMLLTAFLPWPERDGSQQKDKIFS